VSKRPVTIFAVAPLVLGLLAMLPASVIQSADAAEQRVRLRLHTAVERLVIAGEVRRGYDRDRFRHWIDADADCRDTRDEVLKSESTARTTGRCDITRGRWVSVYDGRVVRASSKLDIDHMVPLAEAWDSGARRWNADTRKRFANDLGDTRSLIAVTASTNRSKSDRDPAQWLPQRNRCLYVRHWVAVKTRWGLKVDRPEKRALRRQARGCANRVLVVRKATIRRAGGGGTGGGDGLDPRFDYCYQAKDAGYGPYYAGKDPEYAWYDDADADGVVCE